MIKKIKAMTPLWLKDIYRSFQSRFKCLFSAHIPNRDVISGHWNMDISVPETEKKVFLQSALMGTVDLAIETPHINVLLCAQPKSASLYILKLLSSSLGFKDHKIGFNNSGGELYYPRVLSSKYSGENTVSHCHAEATPQVRKIITALNVRPIILTRNLLDSLVSRRDMLLRDKWADNIIADHAIDAFVSGSHEYQMDVIIDLYATEYMNFFEGWQQYKDDETLNPIYITYQQLIDDEVGLVQRVAKELNVDIADEVIEDTSAKISKAGGINFSTGIVGRGRKSFSDSQINLLRMKAKMIGCLDEDFLGFEMDQQSDASNK